MDQDPDDIFRVIDETNQGTCNQEITRLLRKRRGLKSSFTRSVNSLAVLITNARGENDTFDRSANQPINRERERLETRYERLQRLNDRCVALAAPGDLQTMQGYVTEATTAYDATIKEIGVLFVQMMGSANAEQGIAGQLVKCVDALKPSFQLSFDNSPSELRNWITQFKAYFEASNLWKLAIPQQQAFLCNALHPDIWTAIQSKIDITTRIFKNMQRLLGNILRKM